MFASSSGRVTPRATRGADVGTASSNVSRAFLAASAAFVLLSAGFATGASAAPIDGAKSTVITTSKQMNVAVDGRFKKISGDVTFDPAHPAAGSAHVNIDITSYDIGSPEYNDTLKSAEWFDSKTYPQATFVSSSITPAGDGKLTVAGKLTIKGKTQDVSVPLTYKTAGGVTTFDGVTAIKRLAYGIGNGEWKDTSVVADEVDIKFHLVVGK
jgi:polyisoprenoid-binding protein YceI